MRRVESILILFVFSVCFLYAQGSSKIRVPIIGDDYSIIVKANGTPDDVKAEAVVFPDNSIHYYGDVLIIYDENAIYHLDQRGMIYLITFFPNAKYPIIPVINFNDDFASIIRKLGQPSRYEEGIISYENIKYTYQFGREVNIFLEIKLIDNAIKSIDVHEYLK